MLSKLLRLCFVAAVALIASRPALIAAEPSKEEAALPAKLLSAIEKSDFDAYVAEGDVNFKNLPRERFTGAVGFLSPKLRGGYEIIYLGDLHKQGARMTVWKIVFKDGSDDALARLTTKDGKLAGFVIN